MNEISAIKADLKRGRLRLASINWLVTELEKQKQITSEIKQKNRYKNYMNIAKENLALEDALKMAREQRDYYKQELVKVTKSYEALKKAL